MNPHTPILGILASGRGSNCEAIVRAIRDGALRARVGIVLSDVPGAPVLKSAAAHGIAHRAIEPARRSARLDPETEQVYVKALREAGVAWVLLAGFMRILGRPLLEAFPGRILNIHPSLLPAFPGLDGPGQAFRYGVRLAGCTVHFVDEGVDSGPIVLQRAVAVRDDDDEEALRARILAEEHRAYVDAVRLVLSGGYHLDGRRVIHTQPSEETV